MRKFLEAVRHQAGRAMLFVAALFVMAKAAIADNITVTDYVDPTQVISSVGTKLGIIIAAVIGVAIAVWLAFMLVKFLRRGVGR